jgi:hypothetical protein
MPSVEEDEVKARIHIPATSRTLMFKRPFKLIHLTKPPMNIFRLGQWILQNFNTTTVLITLGTILDFRALE